MLEIDKIYKESKKELEKKKKLLPYDLLGRSLASSPFFPRDVKKVLQKDKEAKVIKRFTSFNEADLSGILSDAFLVYTNTTQGFSLENLSLLRRYSQKIIIRYDLIFDEYQLLESLVYGADCIYLLVNFLSLKTLKKLSSLSARFGLSVIAQVDTKEDLLKASLASLDILLVKSSNLNKLISYIPNSKLILTDSKVNLNSIDAYLL